MIFLFIGLGLGFGTGALLGVIVMCLVVARGESENED